MIKLKKNRKIKDVMSAILALSMSLPGTTPAFASGDEDVYIQNGTETEQILDGENSESTETLIETDSSENSEGLDSYAQNKEQEESAESSQIESQESLPTEKQEEEVIDEENTQLSKQAESDNMAEGETAQAEEAILDGESSEAEITEDAAPQENVQEAETKEQISASKSEFAYGDGKQISVQMTASSVAGFQADMALNFSLASESELSQKMNKLAEMLAEDNLELYDAFILEIGIEDASGAEISWDKETNVSIRISDKSVVDGKTLFHFTDDSWEEISYTASEDTDGYTKVEFQVNSFSPFAFVKTAKTQESTPEESSLDAQGNQEESSASTESSDDDANSENSQKEEPETGKADSESSNAENTIENKEEAAIEEPVIPEGLDPDKVNIWKNELKEEGFLENEISEMEGTLSSKEGSLQYIISRSLIEELSYPKEIQVLNTKGKMNAPSLRASSIPVNESGLITLQQDYEETLVIPQGVDIVLDLNGHTISAPASSAASELITVYGNLTLTDSASGGSLDGSDVTNMRGIRVTSGGTFAMNGGIIKNFTTEGSGGGIYIENNRAFSMTGGTVTGNTAAFYGGGIYIYNVGDASITGGTISNNSAKDGGGIAFNVNSIGKTTPYAITADVIGNTASSRGGGLYFDTGVNLILSNCSINENNGFTGGGIIFVSASKLTVNADSEINRNISSNAGGGVRFHFNAGENEIYVYGNINENESTNSSGGGIYFDASVNSKITATPRTTVMIDGGHVDGNKAFSHGGGININSINQSNEKNDVTLQNGATVNNNRITGDELNRYGGGIETSSRMRIYLRGGQINGNTGATRGGGIATTGNNNIVYIYEGFEICENIVNAGDNGYGGGGYFYGVTTLNITGAIFDSNECNSTGNAYGGGMYMGGASGVSMTDVQITNNKAFGLSNNTGHGGGIYAGSNFTINGNSVISDNVASGSGGGIYSPVTLNDNTIVTRNTATNHHGGGVYGTTVMNDNAVISYNKAPANYGGGVAGSLTMNGGEICFNSSKTEGGGVRVISYSSSGAIKMNAGSIHDNTSQSSGGGVYMQGVSKSSYINGEIYNNHATGSGGGICVIRYNNDYHQVCTIEIRENAYIHDNTATSYGGGVYVGAWAGVTMNGGVITRNSAVYGGGIYAYNNAATSTVKSGRYYNIEEGILPIKVTAGAIYENTAVTNGNDIYAAATIYNDAPNYFEIAAASDLKDQSPSAKWYCENSNEYITEALNNRQEVDEVMASGGNKLPHYAFTYIERSDTVAKIGETEYITVQAAMDAIKNGENEGTIYMIANSREDVKVPDGYNITFDLNGFELHGIDESVITVPDDSTLILEDSSENKTGTITGGRGVVVSGSDRYGTGIMLYGTLVMNGGNITKNKGTSYAVYLQGSKASFTMNGGSITDNTGAGVGRGNYKNDIVINDGLISGNKTDGIFAGYGGGSGHTEINGGVISDNGRYGVYMLRGYLDINGGLIENNSSCGVYVYGDHGTIQARFTMTGGTIRGNNADYGAGLYMRGHTIATISGGEIRENTADYSGAGVYILPAAKMDITFTSSDEYPNGVIITDNSARSGGGVTLAQRSENYKININSAQIYENNSEINEANDIYIVNGATITNILKASDMNLPYNCWKDALTGDEIDTAVSSSGQAYHLTASNKTQTESTVPVARIGQTTYTTLQAAVNAAKQMQADDASQDTKIHLLANITESVAITETSIEVNLNGYTIAPSESQVFYVWNGNLTIDDDDTQEDYNENAAANEYGKGAIISGGTVGTRAVNLRAGECIINDGVIDGFTGSKQGSALFANYTSEFSQSATFTINGGEIRNCSSEFGGAIAVTSATLNINGGTFHDCHADESGGLVYAAPTVAAATAATVVNISGGEFYNLSAGASGGGVYFRGWEYGNSDGTTFAGVQNKFTVTGGTFHDCETGTATGGAICALHSLAAASGTTSCINISNAEFYNCSSGTSGGAIRAGYGKLSLSNLNVHGCEGNYGGGIYVDTYKAGWDATVDNLTLENNKARHTGGGMYVTSSTDLFATNLTIRNNEAIYRGGGIGMYSPAVLENCVIENNQTNIGGGIWHGHGEMTLRNCQINNNIADTHGGGIYWTTNSSSDGGRNLLMEGTTVSGNISLHGGGMYWYDHYSNGNRQVNDCIIENNKSGSSGGGLYGTMAPNVLEKTVFNNTKFIENKADGAGGGIYITNYSTRAALTFTGGTLFRENESKNTSSNGGGGGIYASVANLKFDDVIFENNKSAGYGGGITSYLTITNIEDITMTGNEAQYGGAIESLGSSDTASYAYSNYAQLHIKGGTFTRNHASVAGGAIYNSNYSHQFDITGGKIVNNTADSYGGGVYSVSLDTTCTLAQGGQIYDNKAGIGQDVYVAYNKSYVSSNIDLIKAEDMFAQEDSKTGIGWFDETTYETIKEKVTARPLMVRFYALTLRYEENKVVAVIGEQEFNSVQSAVQYVADGVAAGTIDPSVPTTIKVVDDSTECVEIPGTVNVKLNLNGHTLTGNGSTAIVVNGTIEIVDEHAPGDTTTKDDIGTITGTAVKAGGGVRVVNGGNAKMSSGQITESRAGNNTASASYGGGAVCVDDGVFELTGTASLNNNKAGNGAAVLVSTAAGTFKMTGGVIENNESLITGNDSFGGSIYNYAGKTFITGGEIRNNKGTYGTIVVNTGTLNINGTEDNKVLIHDNTAKSKGGAIYIKAGTATVGNAEIYQNKVTNAKTSADATVSAGGGIYVNAGNLNITKGCDIHNNDAPRGGGVYIKTGAVKMLGGKITNNTSEIGGGVVQYWNNNSSFVFTGGIIADNQSILSATGNDIYTAYEGTAAGLASYLAASTANHPKTTLIQAAKMDGGEYNVWRDDTYEGNQAGDYILIATNEDGEVETGYLGDVKFITAFIANSQNLQLTADQYDVTIEDLFDKDMIVAGVSANVVTDGTSRFDDGSDLADCRSEELTALDLLSAGTPGFAYSDRTYTQRTEQTTNELRYIEYTGSEYTPGLYEQAQAVTWSAGDDGSSLNGVVRTFDTLTYGVTAAIEAEDATAEPRERKIRYWIEAEIPFSSDEVEFNTSAIAAQASGYVVLTDIDEHGKMVQKLQTYYDINLNESQEAYTATQNVSLNVYSLPNGEIIKPKFRAWVDGNETNESAIPEYEMPNFIRVSAAPKYNVTVDYNKTLAYVGYFDVNRGIEVSETDALENGQLKPGIVYGVIAGYGVTTSLYNDSSSKGLKGIELPNSPLDFDIRFSGTLYLNGTKIDASEKGAYLWAYKENEESDTGRALGSDYNNRNMNWNDEDDLAMTTRYAYNAAPFNSGGGTTACYSGGSWKLTGNQFNGADSEAVYHATVSRFSFNHNSYPNFASDGATGNNFNAAHIKPFSAAYIQVLYPVDKDVEVSEESFLSIDMRTAVSGLDAESITGQEAVSNDADVNGINSMKLYYAEIGKTLDDDASGEMKYGDNYVVQSTGLYLYVGGEGGDEIDKYNDFLATNRRSIAGDTGQGTTPLNSQVFIYGWAQWHSATYRTDDPEEFPMQYIPPEEFNTQTDNVIERNYMTAMNLLQKFDADAYTPVCTKEIINKQFSPTANSFGDGCYYITTSETSTAWSANKTLTGNLTVLYAAKPDGTNWAKPISPNAPPSYPSDVWEVTHDNTYDTDGGTGEMDQYNDENLLYFKSMDDLHEYFGGEGVCVGILYEFRDICIRTGRTLGVQALMQVTDEFGKVGHTYETTNDVRSWSTYRRTYKNAYMLNSAYAGREDLLYKYSYLNEYNGDGSYGLALTPGDDYQYKTLYVPEAPDGKQVLWTHFSDEEYWPGYVKTEYLYGNKVGGTHTGMKSGNNLLLYTLVSGIRIRNTDKALGSNTEKEVYNVSVGERTANYIVNPTIYIASAVQNHELINNGTQQTAIEITLNLDPKLHYNEGSINFDYSESGYNDGELQWEIHYTPGTGGTGDKVVLTAVVTDISKALPSIHYSTTIGDVEAGDDDVVNGQSLNTKATIRAKYTSINQAASDMATDQQSIKVSKNNESAISKSVKERIVEVGEDIEYELRLYNLTADPTRFHFADVFPYNGDGRGTSFTGAYRIKEITLEFVKQEGYNAFTGAGTDGYLKLKAPAAGENGITVPTSEQGMMNIINAGSYQDISNFASVTYDNEHRKITYTISDNSLLQPSSRRSGIAFSGYFPYISGVGADGIYAGVKMSIKCTAVDSEPAPGGDAQLLTEAGETQTGNNVYANSFFYQAGSAVPVNSSIVSATTIMRMISGRVWMDMDKDGLFTLLPTNNSSDRNIQNIKVTLKKVVQNGAVTTYEPAVNVLGNEVVPVYTDANGFYRFDNLSAGLYQVFFDDCDIPGQSYAVSPRIGETINNPHPIDFEYLAVSTEAFNYVQGNKSVADYAPSGKEMEDAKIHTTILLPEKANMTSPVFSSPNWNLGLYYVKMSVAKEWKNMIMNVPEGASIDFIFDGKVNNESTLSWTYMLTQGSGGDVSYSLTNNVGTSTGQVYVSETQTEDGIKNIRWELPSVTLPAETVDGEIIYTIQEAMSAGTPEMFDIQGIQDIPFDISITDAVTDSNGVTTITATNRMVLNRFQFTKTSLESMTDEPVPLANAEFSLMTAVPTGNAAADNAAKIEFVSISQGLYRLKNEFDNSGIKTITTDSTGIVSFEDLPNGTYYLVETKSPADRIRPAGWWTITFSGTDNNVTVSSASASGDPLPPALIPTGETVKNRNEADVGTYYLTNEKSLTVSKLVTGNMGSGTKAFRFKLEIPSEPEGVIATKSIDGVGDVTETVTWNAGVYEFTLTHKDKVVFGNIPAGVEYTVTEIDANKDGYETTSSGPLTGTLLHETSIGFVNNRTVIILTGVDIPTLPGVLMLISSLSAAGTAVYVKKKKKKK